MRGKSHQGKIYKNPGTHTKGKHNRPTRNRKRSHTNPRTKRFKDNRTTSPLPRRRQRIPHTRGRDLRQRIFRKARSNNGLQKPPPKDRKHLRTIPRLYLRSHPRTDGYPVFLPNFKPRDKSWVPTETRTYKRRHIRRRSNTKFQRLRIPTMF